MCVCASNQAQALPIRLCDSSIESAFLWARLADDDEDGGKGTERDHEGDTPEEQLPEKENDDPTSWLQLIIRARKREREEFQNTDGTLTTTTPWYQLVDESLATADDIAEPSAVDALATAVGENVLFQARVLGMPGPAALRRWCAGHAYTKHAERVAAAKAVGRLLAAATGRRDTNCDGRSSATQENARRAADSLTRPRSKPDCPTV